MRDCPEEALKAWAQSLQVARALESRIDEGLTLLEIGRTTHDDERLREAARLLEALGAAVDAGRAWQRQLTAAGHP
jgi:electron transfer flavoprotein alpha subunit